ncbi:hypothetical protein Tco_0915635 [Tanacetum coccineum]
MLKRCEDTNLSLNWEKSHFMVKEGIVLGHKISKSGLEVDRAKVEVIANSSSDTVKGCPYSRQKKELRISVADHHLSRLKILIQNKLRDKEINEASSQKPLGSIALPRSKRIFRHSSKLSTVDLLGDTMVPITQQEKSSIQDSIGPPSTRMPMTLSPIVTFVNVKEKLRNVMRCHKTPSKFAKSLTSGALILWGRSRLQEGNKKVQLNELNELRDQAYENSLIYKEKTKRIHDAKIKNRVFNVGDRVLLFNSRLKIFSGKLKSRWSGPFTIVQVFPYGTVELSQNSGPNFKVNGHRIKHYFGGDIPTEVVPDLQTFPMDQ